MKLELRNVAPMRAANVVAILYGASMLIFTIPMLLIFSVLPEPTAPGAQAGQIPFSTLRWLFVAYPVLGLVFGWFMGLIGAYLYNLIAGRIGGFELDYRPLDRESSQPAA